MVSPRRLLAASLFVMAGLAVIPDPAFAQRGGGAPITLTFQSASGALPVGGAGTSAGSLSFGSVSAYKALTPGVSRLLGSTDYRISTQFGVLVTKVGGTSPNYTLRARLLLAHALEWEIDGVDMTTSYATVALTQPYGSTLTHDLTFVVPFTYSSGLVTTTLDVLAISN